MHPQTFCLFLHRVSRTSVPEGSLSRSITPVLPLCFFPPSISHFSSALTCSNLTFLVPFIVFFFFFGPGRSLRPSPIVADAYLIRTPQPLSNPTLDFLPRSSGKLSLPPRFSRLFRLPWRPKGSQSPFFLPLTTLLFMHDILFYSALSTSPCPCAFGNGYSLFPRGFSQRRPGMLPFDAQPWNALPSILLSCAVPEDHSLVPLLPLLPLVLNAL